MEIAGYFCALLVGISLGSIGMGGSILTIPIMVYMMHVSPMDATGYSLFVVGVTSAVGCAKYIRSRMVDIKTAIIFALPSIFAVFITRAWILPAVPDPVVHAGSFVVSKDLAVLLLFALLMVVIAVNMIRGKMPAETEAGGRHWTDYLFLVGIGLLAGFLTGLIGVGGGFIIIPSLVLLAKTPIRMSVGTSLMVIAVNSFVGFGGELLRRHEHMDILFIMMFAFFSAAGIFIGFRWASQLSSAGLKKLFGWCVLVLGICIFIKEIFFGGY